MNTSPAPARRSDNLIEGSQSPPPAANSTWNETDPLLPSTQAKYKFLNSDNSNPLRNNDVTIGLDVKGNNKLPESMALIEAETINKTSNPEIDDTDDDRETATDPYPGVDDGFFLSDRAGGDGPTFPENGDEPDGRRFTPGRRPLSPGYPYFPEVDLAAIPDLESIPDVNIYQHKKTLAQGMMDLALFSANANQLRYVLESNQHPYYYPGIVLISVSLILQVAIGVGLIWNSRYNVKEEKEIRMANRINNFTVIGIFLVTVVNVFISAFGVATTQPVQPAANIQSTTMSTTTSSTSNPP